MKVETYLLLLLVSLLNVTDKTLITTSGEEDGSGFFYDGFANSTGLISLDGGATISPNGLLLLTNSSRFQAGHAFHSNPIILSDRTSKNSTTFSFSTTFVFAIQSEPGALTGHGLAFVVAPTRGLPGSSLAQNLGLFNRTNNGDPKNRVVAVEFDTFMNLEFGDPDNNHVGIDINGLRSEITATPGYYDDDKRGRFVNLTLVDGEPVQVWVEYDDVDKRLDVTMAPAGLLKPRRPVLSLRRDLPEIISGRENNGTFYFGFSSSTGQLVAFHYLLGWSFQLNGQARDLVLSLPGDSVRRRPQREISKMLTVGVPLISVFVIAAVASVALYVVKMKRKFAEVVEDWEFEYGPQRYKYKDLYLATKGFKDKDLLGSGGFGRVYRGVLAGSKAEIAVKKVSHGSRQGMREFVAEIASMGRLRHRNLVQLLGYCRRRGELLLVYDFMPNGSLDKYLFEPAGPVLDWARRFRVVKGVAAGLFYLHEEWEQVVIHRDVKANNVLLDAEFNARLGDFGLARLYDHGTDPQTTHVAGTLGYMAPEHSRTGKATTSTDVFAFGAFLLEVACGQRPISSRACSEETILVDRVFSCWKKGSIIDAKDEKLGPNFVAEEVELVLKLGLLCSHSEATFRPSMRQTVEYLERHVPLPDLSGLVLSANGLTFVVHPFGLGDFPAPSSYEGISSSMVESLLSGGR